MATETNTKPEIPKTCKAGVVINEGPDFHLAVEDVPVPEPGTSGPLIFTLDMLTRSPGPDDVLIKLNATGICYSDIHYM